MFPDKKSILIG